MNNPTKLGRFESFKIIDFRLYLLARCLLTIALQMQAVIVGWQVYDLTKKPLALGLTGLVEAIPAIVMAMIAGHMVDKNEKHGMILKALLIIFISSLILLISSYNLGSGLSILPIYVALAVSGFGRAFLGPSLFSLVTKIVPRNLYLQSTAWDSSLWQLSAVSGPLLGGLVYAFKGANLAYLITCILLALAFICVLLIKTRYAGEDLGKKITKNEFFKGLKFVFSFKLMLGAMSLDLFAVLFGGAVALLPIFASDILKIGPEGLGMLRAAPALGAVSMGILLALLPPITKAGKVLHIAVAGFGFATIGFGLAKSVVAAWFCLYLTGMFDCISVVIRRTIMKSLAPENMRGRIAAINNIFIGSSNEIGAFESGVTAAWMGTIPAVIFGGVMTSIVVIISSLTNKDLSKLDFSNTDWDKIEHYIKKDQPQTQKTI